MSALRSIAITVLGPAFLCAGCALLSKGEPLRPRYFDPDVARIATREHKAAGSGLPLRLGRIESSSYLREPIAFRNSEQELGYYDTRRWTEKPEEYLRRELARALFEEHGFVRTVSGEVPTLEAELVEFTEFPAQHSVRMRVAILLHDEHAGLLEQTITVERAIAAPAGSDDVPAMVRALSDALHEGVERIAQQVGRTLRAAAPRLATGAGGPCQDSAVSANGN